MQKKDKKKKIVTLITLSCIGAICFGISVNASSYTKRSVGELSYDAGTGNPNDDIYYTADDIQYLIDRYETAVQKENTVITSKLVDIATESLLSETAESKEVLAGCEFFNGLHIVNGSMPLFADNSYDPVMPIIGNVDYSENSFLMAIPNEGLWKTNANVKVDITPIAINGYAEGLIQQLKKSASDTVIYRYHSHKNPDGSDATLRDADGACIQSAPHNNNEQGGCYTVPYYHYSIPYSKYQVSYNEVTRMPEKTEITETVERYGYTLPDNATLIETIYVLGCGRTENTITGFRIIYR